MSIGKPTESQEEQKRKKAEKGKIEYNFVCYELDRLVGWLDGWMYIYIYICGGCVCVYVSMSCAKIQ